ncbi:MAG: hypothetical protein HFE63_06565 [Clostridiales bacterium]|nr:hypothetical protein [Clostridiales bacterium]
MSKPAKPQKERKPGFFKQLENEYRRSKPTFILYVILRILVIAVGVRQFFIGNFENVFLCGMTLLLFLVPAFVERLFKVSVPSALEIIVLVFIFAAEILGEISDYYVKFSMWDTMLHTTTGFLAAAVGLSLIDILNRNDKFGLKLSPFFVALVSFCFSMTIGVLWEFFEFGADLLFMTDMQKDTIVTSISSVLLNPEPINKAIQITDITETVVNGTNLGINGYLDIGLYDTMKDLFVNFIGALTFSIVGFFNTKRNDKRGNKIIDGLKITKNIEPEKSNES